MDGVLTCARYAFAPNYYKYCGPDANRGIAAYLKEGVSDSGLSSYLSEFAVLYPYLKLIAHENGYSDPFDPKVVEAYWVGNQLLEKVGMDSFSDHLLYGQRLKHRIPKKSLKWIIDKVPKGAKIHHSFHVFSIFTRTGHHTVEHTLDTMDQCRIGWGRIVKSIRKDQTLNIRVKSQKLIYEHGKILFNDGVFRDVTLPVDNDFKSSLKIGDWVSFHWGYVCDKITKSQAYRLAFYTKHNLVLANGTI